MDYPEGLHGKKEGESEPEKMTKAVAGVMPSLALKTVEGATSPNMWAGSRSWERQESRFSSRASRRNAVLATP